ncbi:type II toxin-antitoxin system RelE/ParE family toxin [Paenibacillus chitinolyticus]|uniref:type II toxin-antitoxin system RelE/ParE family toxin n=1 Tax=Paenibacillus chitinolyticus TaxID=79263 RepID=UPI0036433D9C
MNIKWTQAARVSLKQIQSQHYTREETKRYQIELVRKIQHKILLLSTAMPTNEPSWAGTYRIFIDRYKVYYSFSADYQTVYIEALRHQHQKSD